MSFKEKSAFCSACNRQVLVRKQTPNHVLHFLIALFTCGLWLIVWLLIGAKKSGDSWLCTSCGRPAINQSLHESNLSNRAGSSSFTNSPIKIGACVIGGLVVLSWIGALLSISSKPNGATPLSHTPQSSSTPLSVPPDSTSKMNSTAYKTGYQKGFQEGKAWARKNWEIPMPIGIKGMAINRADDAKTDDKLAYQAGFESGFPKGFTSIKKVTRKDEDYEPLSWSNAKIGVKLYNYWEEHEVTIVGIDQQAGLITVKYAKNGTVEDKDLNALSRLWFVRKKS
jgi:hypothetical protein